ncbi:MAG: hypothetical protein AAGF77_08440 [Bacteroidota bacterium]
MRNQEVRANVYIPKGTMLTLDQSVKSNLKWDTKNDQNLSRNGIISHLWRMGTDGKLECLDCSDTLKENERDKIIINDDGINIDVQDGKESFKMKIDENGVRIEANDN